MFEGIAAIVGSSFERAPWGWGVLIMLATIMARLRPIMTKLAAEREASLLSARAADNADLRSRIEALEGKLESDRAQHEAERAADRHRINNLNACLDALLMMLELAPDRVAEHVARIKDMRTRQSEVESQEKAAIHAAVITATGMKS